MPHTRHLDRNLVTKWRTSFELNKREMMEKKKKGRKTIKQGEGDARSVLLWSGISSTLCITVFALLIRVLVSIHPYSGAGDSPKYGDFEAQRHWMEITLNTPVREWYKNTTSNNLSYWGLDYPPLTAYQSYAHSLFLHFFHPKSVALVESRGHESPLGKFLMRLTVVSSDILIFFPATIYFLISYYMNRGMSTKEEVAWHLAMILVNPCLILIDHGHFQFNCISLGLTIAAVAAIFRKNELVACVLFSLALNHKQMSLYFAPAFFSHLFGKSLRHRNPIFRVTSVGLVVLGTFVFLWWPYLYSANSVLEVLSRLAPFERGIYEDYVANFWCTTSVLIKWKRLFTTPTLKIFSFTATMLFVLPSMIQQIRDPSDKGFLYALLNSSFSFYLFSFQVHEKSILLPLLPASLLVLEEPLLLKWFTYFALFSMFPLLCRDQLIIPYIALLGLFFLICHSPNIKQVSRYGRFPTGWKAFVVALLLICTFVLHLIYLFLKPPKKYPYLFEAMIMLICFSQFVLLATYTNIKQWKLNSSITLEKKKKVQ